MSGEWCEWMVKPTCRHVPTAESTTRKDQTAAIKKHARNSYEMEGKSFSMTSQSILRATNERQSCLITHQALNTISNSNRRTI